MIIRYGVTLLNNFLEKLYIFLKILGNYYVVKDNVKHSMIMNILKHGHGLWFHYNFQTSIDMFNNIFKHTN